MDLSRVTTLNSSDDWIDIENHFKLFAGPGAGKTRFLVNHINNIITNSARLKRVRKIACITYTNTGVNTILSRIENAIDHVEVCTIHSFLYKNVLKPYLWVLKDIFQIPLSEIDGHDEIIPRYSILSEWKKNTSQNYIKDDNQLKKDLMGLRWTLKDDNSCELKLKYPSILRIKKKSLIEYKKECWKNALISHDDVLYLSFEILKKEDRVLDILRAKFPYILIDEFQDTSPIQSEIIKMIGKKETIVGVIGDVGQSIFSFQGADCQKFIDFHLDQMKLYKIENNHRSTEQIVKVLNHVRNQKGFEQISIKKKQGSVPKIIVGNFFDAYNKVCELTQSNKICTLSYRNDISNIMKSGIENYFSGVDVNEPIFSDSTGNRGWIITYTITAIEYCLQNKIKDAIKFMKKAYRKSDGFSDKEALENLKRLVNNYDKFKDGNVKELYNSYIFNHYNIRSKISRGTINDYYEKLKYQSIAINVKINDDDSLNRTIHKAKGDEFANVLVIIPKENGVFNEEKSLKFLLKPSIDDEENRVYYVALSRAQENLFINVPTLSQENKKIIEKIGFEVLLL
ncbi:MAG: ATP-dependent helicase UvrD/PcrA [Candidatus Petromonas sp.]|jgi:DNA helicase-2/ATP-dependent DNA helicase PcrA|nr:ATP-dependent helicase UvrD/PcrA [Thermoanaerobacterium sp.]MDK2919157.1 ATP-dependent helicase UvrD/PcrA [Candidatus Petromonas sp.]